MTSNAPTFIQVDDVAPSHPLSTADQIIQQLRKKVADEYGDDQKGSILERHWCQLIPSGNDSDTRVRIMQWNILAQGFCSISNFYHCSRDTLSYPRRLHMILWELLRHHADIVCLEEADLFPQIVAYFQEYQLPYRGIFQAKPRSACLSYPENYGPDGCALIFRTDRFQLESENVVHLCNQPDAPLDGVVGGSQIAVFVRLREISTGALILVVCTHLKASTEFHHLRAYQGQIILSALEEEHRKSPEAAIFVCGDFNADPHESVISQFQESPIGLRSVYRHLHALQTGKDEETPFTTWKTRFGGRRGDQRPTEEEVAASGGKLLFEACHTIDYMWFASAKARPVAVLRLPSKEEIGATGLPRKNFPSDHLSLVAEFGLVPK